MLASIKKAVETVFGVSNSDFKGASPPLIAQRLNQFFPSFITMDLNDFDKLIQFPSMTTQKERHFLFLLSLMSSIKGDVVEIGSWLGGTTSYLAKGCQVASNGKVIAIDHFEGNPGKEELYRAEVREDETIFQVFQRNISIAGMTEHVQALKMDSLSARKIIQEPVRMVFIDGNHEYDSVKQDIQLWEPLLKSGGYLVFHDFTNAEGVSAAVRELDSEKYKICVLVDSMLVLFSHC